MHKAVTWQAELDNMALGYIETPLYCPECGGRLVYLGSPAGNSAVFERLFFCKDCTKYCAAPKDETARAYWELQGLAKASERQNK